MSSTQLLHDRKPQNEQECLPLHKLVQRHGLTKIRNPLLWRKAQLDILAYDLHNECLTPEDLEVQNSFGTPGSLAPIEKAIGAAQFNGNGIEIFSALLLPHETFRSKLPFHYNKHCIAHIEVPCISSNYQFAYIDRIFTEDRRSKLYQHLKKTVREDYDLLQEARNFPIDPLYVAILIAMARMIRSLKKENTLGQTVHLFVPRAIHATAKKIPRRCDSAYNQDLVQYSATVSDTYLKKFDDPGHFHEGKLDIYEKSLPVQLPLSKCWTDLKELFSRHVEYSNRQEEHDANEAERIKLSHTNSSQPETRKRSALEDLGKETNYARRVKIDGGKVTKRRDRKDNRPVDDVEE